MTKPPIVVLWGVGTDENTVTASLRAVLSAHEIHRTIPEAIAALGDSPNIIWATGPSKTADVEGILIEGVHGPGEQIALLMD